MKPLDHALSPIVRNRSLIAQNITPNDRILMDTIRQQKINLLTHHLKPSEIDLVRPEVVESWIRSYNNGLDLFDYNYGPILDKPTFEQKLEEKTLLLRSADPFIHQLENLLSDSESIILLTDEQGVMLKVVEGNHQLLEQQNRRFHLVPGSVWTEDTVGTCAHVITINSKTPMQICGPEHYCETYDQISCSSAPIFDSNYNLAGTLCIVSPTFYHQSYHTLALVLSMAWAMQKEFQLELNNSLISSTLEAADEAVITINQSGIITHCNIIARNIFNRLEHSLIGTKIEELLGEQPLINSVLINGKPIFNADIEVDCLDQKLNLRLAQPIQDNYGLTLGCVLIFRKLNKRRKISLPACGLETRFTFNNIIGESDKLKQTINLAQKFANSDFNVLIEGESGTGKELLAQAIHNHSKPYGPFIAVNCAAIPHTLIESELFGYEGGAFTGAEKQGRPGKIELANEGTLFLDEIGDMPLELQPVLLRVLEEKQVMRIGSNRYIPVNFRLIAATNNNLSDLVNEGKFRSDLYYRLKVLEIKMPPLRERGQDILILSRYFISKFAKIMHKSPPTLSDLAILHLLRYTWPGNVRELENALLYACNICSNNVITPNDLPADIIKELNSRTDIVPQPKLSVKEIEEFMIREALNQTSNNVSEAANLLKISRSTLYRKLKSYKIRNEP